MKERRNLSGIYFRVGGENVCFEDLSKEEQENQMKDMSIPFLKGLVKCLAESLHDLGDKFNIYESTVH